jgi:hypothetical protein
VEDVAEVRREWGGNGGTGAPGGKVVGTLRSGSLVFRRRWR